MLGENKEPPGISRGNKPIETMALTVKNTFDRFNGEQKNSQKNGRPWCNHCNKVGHTRDPCWDIHRKLANWKPRGLNRSKGFQASVEEREVTRAQNESNVLMRFSGSSNTSPSSIISFWLGSIGVLRGLEPNIPVSSNRSSIYLCWDIKIPLLDNCTTSIPKKYLSCPKSLV
ncbi:hypothetical protein CFOL_v3_00622 [Cephalotus follicularis]|uniref:Uncharacterized protein n=1 Tax=Cephalotus follicularis TaxID=3775 RepID=A0A1Q3AN15_CEPFO|nr:hypothetical protein CFOL_v3_00622 [Cephalotus follicularis]